MSELNKDYRRIAKEAAKRMADDYDALFNLDTMPFTIIEKVIVKRDIDALINVVKRTGDILDSNRYGLKSELENNEAYTSALTDLAQKRVRLKIPKKKNNILQKNINRVRSLTYGLNSHILLRSILDSIPEARENVPAEVRVMLESIETVLENVLNTMLNDLEREWK